MLYRMILNEADGNIGYVAVHGSWLFEAVFSTSPRNRHEIDISREKVRRRIRLEQSDEIHASNQP